MPKAEPIVVNPPKDLNTDPINRKDVLAIAKKLIEETVPALVDKAINDGEIDISDQIAEALQADKAVLDQIVCEYDDDNNKTKVTFPKGILPLVFNNEYFLNYKGLQVVAKDGTVSGSIYDSLFEGMFDDDNDTVTLSTNKLNNYSWNNLSLLNSLTFSGGNIAIDYDSNSYSYVDSGFEDYLYFNFDYTSQLGATTCIVFNFDVDTTSSSLTNKFSYWDADTPTELTFTTDLVISVRDQSEYLLLKNAIKLDILANENVDQVDITLSGEWANENFKSLSYIHFDRNFVTSVNAYNLYKEIPNYAGTKLYKHELTFTFKYSSVDYVSGYSIIINKNSTQISSKSDLFNQENIINQLSFTNNSNGHTIIRLSQTTSELIVFDRNDSTISDITIAGILSFNTTNDIVTEL